MKKIAGNKENPLRMLASQSFMIVIILGYLGFLLILLLAELGVPALQWLRATNQVLILLALFFLPFLLLGISRSIGSLTLKLSGQEVHLELRDLKREMTGEVRQIQGQVAAQVSNAEQALWPMLAGKDINSKKRWRNKQLVIGAKQDLSQLFFAHLLAEWLERNIAGLHCELRVPNGGSLKNFADLKYQWIDLYVDFIGTACQFFYIDHHNKTHVQLVDELNGYGESVGVKFLEPLGASESYCLVMRREKAESLGVTNLANLALVADRLTFSGDAEFLNRRDCFLGLVQEYNLSFKSVEACDINERYAALEDGHIDVFVGYETDPELRREDLVVLEDNQQFFPPYEALVVANRDLLAALPEIETILSRLEGKLSTNDLIAEVHKLSINERHPAIARDLVKKFLTLRKLV